MVIRARQRGANTYAYIHTQTQIHTLPHNRRTVLPNPRTPPHFRAYVSTVLPIGFPRASIPTATRQQKKSSSRVNTHPSRMFSARLQVSLPSPPPPPRDNFDWVGGGME